MISDLDAIFRLIVAVFLGGIVGFERQSRNKTAGLRTHILVSLGSCLVMILSINVHINYNNSGGDAARLAAQVVSGIGFLGAGTILANKKGLNIIGLTTAASLWTVSAIGLTVGSGYWVMASATTILVYLTLGILSRIEQRIKTCSSMACQHNFLITTTNRPGQIGKIGDYFGKVGVSIRDFHTVSVDEEKNQLDIFVGVEIPAQVNISQIISGLLKVETIFAVQKE